MVAALLTAVALTWVVLAVEAHSAMVLTVVVVHTAVVFLTAVAHVVEVRSAMEVLTAVVLVVVARSAMVVVATAEEATDTAEAVAMDMADVAKSKLQHSDLSIHHTLNFAH